MNIKQLILDNKKNLAISIVVMAVFVFVFTCILYFLHTQPLSNSIIASFMFCFSIWIPVFLLGIFTESSIKLTFFIVNSSLLIMTFVSAAFLLAQGDFFKLHEYDLYKKSYSVEYKKYYESKMEGLDIGYVSQVNIGKFVTIDNFSTVDKDLVFERSFEVDMEGYVRGGTSIKSIESRIQSLRSQGIGF